MHDSSNELFKLAASFVNHTGQNIFLTGRAGTGKTTFLKYIREHTGKHTAVVAPTGVAAINAGGVTAHSMFGLPFGVFIPGTLRGFADTNSKITDKHSLFKNMKMAAERRKLLQELELLIIDEVSMLRCDMLDAIDTILRSVRRKGNAPFGGVQVLFIGDLFQLPPVARPDEWDILKDYYESPFFFHAKAVQEAPPVLIELKKIYRQSEGNFISILNNIRNNTAEREDLELLHRHYKPGFQPRREDNYILLTSHNAKADEVNRKELAKLGGDMHHFDAEISGDFSENAYPAERTLGLKVGAQVMFIKNDKGDPRRYYNGRIAQVLSITDKDVAVMFPDTKESLVLEKETWKNIRYKYDEKKQLVDEEELGTFKQYPIRLAWAITIHKSQGLTFERAIVDAGDSFAPGQVYVALSRLTTLDGLILHSPIHQRAIATDVRVLDFAAGEMPLHELQSHLQKSQTGYLHTKLVAAFSWTKIINALAENHAAYTARSIPHKEKASEWSRAFIKEIQVLEDVAAKFRGEITGLMASALQNGYGALSARVAKGAAWFAGKLQAEILEGIKKHYKEFEVKPRTKKYLAELNGLAMRLQRKEQELTTIRAITAGLAEGVDIDLIMDKEGMPAPVQPMFNEPKGGAADAKGGASALLTLSMFDEGRDVAEIGAERGLAISTIESHLVAFIRTGELQVERYMTKEKRSGIMNALKLVGERNATSVKQLLGDEYSYADVRAVFNHLAFMEEKG